MRDVIIVGAGPAGLALSRTLAAEGFDVAVYEEHQSSGDPVHCTGVLAAEAFDHFPVPKEVVLNPLRTVRFYAPGGAAIEYTTERIEALVIDRLALDRALFAEARRAGVEVMLGRRVTDVGIDADAVTISLADGSVARSRACVLACGAHYVIQRRVGLGMPAAFLQSAQLEIPARTPGDVEVRFGRDVAPGGFAWAVPVIRPAGTHARVGLMCDQGAARFFDLLIDRLSASWGLITSGDNGAKLPPRQKMLPLAPLRRTFADRLLAVGDAAGLVKATTGGGIYYSLLSASLAAETLAPALRTNRLTAAALQPYERAWKGKLGPELKAQLRLRLLSQRLSDNDIEAFFELARTDGVMPIVRKTARFNQHRELIVSLLRHPPARRVLFRRLVSRETTAEI
jgi:geranylgeranyl reductase family protein